MGVGGQLVQMGTGRADEHVVVAFVCNLMCRRLLKGSADLKPHHSLCAWLLPQPLPCLPAPVSQQGLATSCLLTPASPLFPPPPGRSLHLGSRLLRVTDATTRALVEQGTPLRELKLTLSATDESLRLLADSAQQGDGCEGLAVMDVRRNGNVSEEAVEEVVARCAALLVLRLPARMERLAEELQVAGWGRRDVAGKGWLELVRGQ